MAWMCREGRAGWKADLLRFSHPSGQVTTTSSNWWVSPAAVVNITLRGALEFSRKSVSILMIGWLKRMSACWMAALET